MLFRRHPFFILCALWALSASLPARAGAPSGKLSLGAGTLEASVAFWRRFPSAQADKVVAELERADWLSEGPHSVERGLAAVSLTDSGRAILGQVYPLYVAKQLRIVSTQSVEAVRLSGRVDAAGMYYQSAVYIDDRAPLLAFAATLFHELVHARDYLATESGKKNGDALADYNAQVSALKKAKSEGREPSEVALDACRAAKRAITPILLASEHEAYLAQNRFLAEFEKFDEGFGPLMEELTVRQYWVAYPMREFDFQYLMSHRNGGDLPRAEVEAYLKAHPFNGARR